MEWSEETIGRLRALWSEGHATAEIGRRLGVSKNAIVGKAHRLDLPSRPSPIRRDGGQASGERRPPAPRRTAGPTLPPLTSTGCASSETARSISVAPVSRPAVAAPASRVQVVPRAYGRTVDCCWPVGEPGTRGFHFCGQNSVPGKPYCQEHAKLAYVRVRDRHEDAA